MIIYIDESKKLWEWKIVFWWFISKHNDSYIQKIVSQKKNKYGLSENLEIKGKNNTWKNFYSRMSQDIDFSFLQNSIIGIYIEDYYYDSLENYYQCLSQLFNRIRPIIEWCNEKIVIYADRVNLWKVSVVQSEIEKRLCNNFSINKSIKLIFKSSKDNAWIQISDLLAYQLRLTCINNEVIDDFVLSNSCNLDFKEKFKIQ